MHCRTLVLCTGKPQTVQAWQVWNPVNPLVSEAPVIREPLFHQEQDATRPHSHIVRRPQEVVSGRGESHPPALVEPDVNLAIHPAPITQPSRLCELPVDEQFPVGSFDPLKELHGPTAASAQPLVLLHGPAHQILVDLLEHGPGQP